MKFIQVGKYTINLFQVNYIIDWKNEGNNKIDIAFTNVAYLGGDSPQPSPGGTGLGDASRAAWIVLVEKEADKFRVLLANLVDN